MREIRFRVWDEDRQKMYYQLENAPSFGACEDDRAVSIEDVFFYEKDNFVKMQFTGRVSECGKLIYEADVVELFIHGMFKIRGFVEFTDSMWMINDSRGFYPLDVHEEQIVRVLGNTFENRELIKEETK